MASPALQPFRLEARRLLAASVLGVAALVAMPAQAAMARSVADTAPQPSGDAAYQQLVDAANAVVGVKVKALPNARSNESLGQERVGSGIIIPRDNLVLTIGYLILEADQVEITDSAGQKVPATVVAYDHATGFGLLKPMAPLTPKPIRFGSAGPVTQLDRLMIVTGGDEQVISIATVVSK